MSDPPVIGRAIQHYSTVQSTNDVIRSLAERGEPEGLVISADEQLAGRGRLGRQWIVPRGTSLQMSILLRPALEIRFAHRVTQMAALAVAQTLEKEFSLLPTLKWPNDVLLQGLKVSGILTETSLSGEIPDYIILGIGVNVNYTMHMYPELAPTATTVQDVLGREVDRVALERALLAELERQYARVRSGTVLLDEYRARLGMLGQRIQAVTSNGVIEGTAKDIAEDGALVVATRDSTVRLYAGDVTLSRVDDSARD
jgi:BirA family transcriptional regulator, biotin operon repressor / biotin---[acetyl-CoA-carboxylase] ligase